MVSPSNRAFVRRRALTLEYLTVGWNLVEAAVGIVTAIASGSVALLGFGVDSVLESISAAILIWRLVSETDAHDAESTDRLDRLAHQLVAILMFALAAYIAADAVWTLWFRYVPVPSTNWTESVNNGMAPPVRFPVRGLVTATP